MTFNDREFSLANGRPVRLYEIVLDTNRWRYTNAEREITFNGQAYQPIPITDDGIRQTGQATADTLTLTVPDDLPLVRYFTGHPPSAETWLTIRDTHHGLPDQPDAALVVWIGTLMGVRWETPGQVEIACTSLSASMGRMGLRLTYERNCPHCLFDSCCRVPRMDWAHPTTITALDGASVTVASLPANYYIGGYILWMAMDGINTQRAIEFASGQTLTLLSGTAGLAIGQAVIVFPGCNQTSEMCQTTYNNLRNFGGFRHLPGTSPFEAMLFY